MCSLLLGNKWQQSASQHARAGSLLSVLLFPLCCRSLQAGDCQAVIAAYQRMKALGMERNSFTYR